MISRHSRLLTEEISLNAKQPLVLHPAWHRCFFVKIDAHLQRARGTLGALLVLILSRGKKKERKREEGSFFDHSHGNAPPAHGWALNKLALSLFLSRALERDDLALGVNDELWAAGKARSPLGDQSRERLSRIFAVPPNGGGESRHCTRRGMEFILPRHRG